MTDDDADDAEPQMKLEEAQRCLDRLPPEDVARAIWESGLTAEALKILVDRVDDPGASAAEKAQAWAALDKGLLMMKEVEDDSDAPVEQKRDVENAKRKAFRS